MDDSFEPNVMDHEYDGIREYDNPTPGWWHAIFAGTIVFGAVYAFYAEFSPLYVKPEEAHAAAEARAMMAIFGDVGEWSVDEQTLLTLMDVEDGRWKTFAAGKFAGKCASCHGASGQGMVGPNLTDDYWKNVKSVTDLYSVISDGAAGGNMPAQKNLWRHNEIVLLASYVASLRGSNPPGGFAADGEEIPPWPEVEAPAGEDGAGG